MVRRSLQRRADLASGVRLVQHGDAQAPLNLQGLAHSCRLDAEGAPALSVDHDGVRCHGALDVLLQPGVASDRGGHDVRRGRRAGVLGRSHAGMSVAAYERGGCGGWGCCRTFGKPACGGRSGPARCGDAARYNLSIPLVRWPRRAANSRAFPGVKQVQSHCQRVLSTWSLPRSVQ